MIQKVNQYISVNKKGRFKKGLLTPFLISEIPKNSATILDAGCGAGQYHQAILTHLPELQRFVGFDVSQQILANARTLNKSEKIQYLCLDATSIKLQQKFDCITASFVIEHMNHEELGKFFQSSKQVLKSNSCLILLSIDTNTLLKSPAYQKSIKYTVICQGQLKNGDKFQVKVGNWSNKDTHWSPQFLSEELIKRGFKVQLNYIKKDILDKQLYSQEEAQQIEDAKCVYCLRAWV